MKLVKKALIVLSVLILVALLCLTVYSFRGPRNVPLWRIVPGEAGLCLSVMDLDERWPEVEASGFWKRMVGIELVPERRSFLLGFLGREALAFYSSPSGLCVVSRLSVWQRFIELPGRLWMLATDGEWSRERYMGIELVRIEQRKDRPAFMYFIYGDLGFLMVGAEPSQMRAMVELLLGEGGGGGKALSEFAPGHFVSLYLRPAELLEFDLKEEYAKAKKRYRDPYLPPCWTAVEEINTALLKNGQSSLFGIYSQLASSLREDDVIFASLDIAEDNVLIEWSRSSKVQPLPGGASLRAYAAVLPANMIGVIALGFDSTVASGQSSLPISVTPVDDDIKAAYEERVGEILSHLDGSAALAFGKPSIFSSLLPACAILKLKEKDAIFDKINALLDMIAGRKMEVRALDFTTTVKSKAGHRVKSHSGYEYFILKKSGPFVWSYVQIDDMLVISTHSNLIKNVIDAFREPARRLSSSRSFLEAVEPLTGAGRMEGFLDLRTLVSYALTALDLYALKEAFASPREADETDTLTLLRSVLEIMDCVGTVAWEGSDRGGRIVVPMTIDD